MIKIETKVTGSLADGKLGEINIEYNVRTETLILDNGETHDEHDMLSIRGLSNIERLIATLIAIREEVNIYA